LPDEASSVYLSVAYEVLRVAEVTVAPVIVPSAPLTDRGKRGWACPVVALGLDHRAGALEMPAKLRIG
jgi:hypothetical protein